MPQAREAQLELACVLTHNVQAARAGLRIQVQYGQGELLKLGARLPAKNTRFLPLQDIRERANTHTPGLAARALPKPHDPRALGACTPPEGSLQPEVHGMRFAASPEFENAHALRFGSVRKRVG